MSDWLLIDGARRLFGETCTYEVVQAAEADGWSPSVWSAVADAGYESLAEMPLADALALLTVAGEHAAPVPLAEALLSAPSFTIRGGTNEILRSVAAKGLSAL